MEEALSGQTEVTDEEVTRQKLRNTTPNTFTQTAETCLNSEMYSIMEQSPCEETGQKLAGFLTNLIPNGHPPEYTDAPPEYSGPPRIYDPQIIM